LDSEHTHPANLDQTVRLGVCFSDFNGNSRIGIIVSFVKVFPQDHTNLVANAEGCQHKHQSNVNYESNVRLEQLAFSHAFDANNVSNNDLFVWEPTQVHRNSSNDQVGAHESLRRNQNEECELVPKKNANQGCRSNRDTRWHLPNIKLLIFGKLLDAHFDHRQSCHRCSN
jgi:hypothetical protein